MYHHPTMQKNLQYYSILPNIWKGFSYYNQKSTTQRIYSYKLYLQSNVRTATSVGDFESGGTLTGWKSIFKAFDTGVAIIFCKRSTTKFV